MFVLRVRPRDSRVCASRQFYFKRMDVGLCRDSDLIRFFFVCIQLKIIYLKYFVKVMESHNFIFTCIFRAIFTAILCLFIPRVRDRILLKRCNKSYFVLVRRFLKKVCQLLLSNKDRLGKYLS